MSEFPNLSDASKVKITKREARATAAPSSAASGPVARTNHPYGTDGVAEWRAMSQPLAQAVRKTTKARPDVFIAGSAVTGQSFADKPNRPKGTPFDNKSDFDMGIASDTLYERVKAANKSHLSHDDGPNKTRALGPRELHSVGLPDLARGVRTLREQSGRKVSLAIFESDSAREANAGRPYIQREHSPPPPRRRAQAVASPSAASAAAAPASHGNSSKGPQESKKEK